MSVLPSELAGPIQLALAKGADRIPASGAMPGACIYEPKWDGFRAQIVRAGEKTVFWSRQGKDLTRYFPDVWAAAEESVPPGFVLDGELVVWAGDRLDFGSLQRRMTTSQRTLADLVRNEPASFVAFDVLAVAGHDTRDLPWRDRRVLLEELARDWEPPLQLSPYTQDGDQAVQWMEELHEHGIEGLVAKGTGQPYRGGRREWIKVKHRRVVDVVCAAVIGPMDRPDTIVAGLHIDGRLRIVGRSTPLRPNQARDLAAHLRPPAGAHPWPATVTSSAVDRFARKKEPVALTLVEPLVVEVSADTAWSGTSFRHPLRYVRARPELPAEDVEPPR